MASPNSAAGTEPAETNLSANAGSESAQVSLSAFGGTAVSARAAVFLASDESDFIYAIDLPVDGGALAIRD